MVYSKRLNSSFSRRQNLNYIHFFSKLYPHSLNSQDFLHTIIISSRREIIKTPKKFLKTMNIVVTIWTLYPRGFSDY